MCFNYSNVVATIALFCALGGGAYAAVEIHGRDVVDGSLTGRDLRNGSVRSADVAGLRAKDFAGGVLPAAQPGPAGPPGPRGAKGDRGDTGQQGPPGPIEGTPAGGMLAGTYPNPSLSAFPAAHVTRARGYTIPSGTETPISFDTEAFDSGRMHATTDDFVRVKRPGVYLLHASLAWSGGRNALRRLTVLVNDTATAVRDETSGGHWLTQEATAVRRLASGDKVHMTALQDSGSSVINNNWSAAPNAELAVQWISR